MNEQVWYNAIRNVVFITGPKWKPYYGSAWISFIGEL